MAGNEDRIFVHQHWVGEPKLEDRSTKLLDLPFGVGPRVAWIRFEVADRPINDRQRASG
jgi:hypothetical protein